MFPDVSRKKQVQKQIVALVFLFIIIALLCFGLTIHTVVVSGGSMEPTLYDGDLLRCDKVREPADIHVGDVVVIESKRLGTKRLIKRVIALPGDALDYSLSEYGKYTIPISLGNGEYFVCGDNRDNSVDSRDFGPVYYDEIVWRVRV